MACGVGNLEGGTQRFLGIRQSLGVGKPFFWIFPQGETKIFGTFTHLILSTWVCHAGSFHQVVINEQSLIMKQPTECHYKIGL